ncbi:ligase-associated DNA damage response endonuclease PdeM [Loktanella sp. IMCC34160]|uniref:ligase-associated DNA damage response endonuclease PdeM n=1 Tax=Loktanella sp. IMCC34160 TaxID=2510646 RepID=UPI00101BAEA1|nr:ligase-associated DNA damage response endonuclease PdeM [Loktanella sp. IMCC34160]RYG90824.1 ligase-associated DNA damage response endonuclease PdeM [Loktanella sp. IMCC34160]
MAHAFTLAGTPLHALPSGALWLPDHAGLCVSDLHLGKSERIARRTGGLLPPYEVQATLDKLEADIAARDPETVICLGDSFDDLSSADALEQDAVDRLATLQAGRRWVWIEGNHDPGPVALGGTHLNELTLAGLTFRHIALPHAAPGEVSGHYHPKHRISGGWRPAFLFDRMRLILPAYGTYTGGLRSSDRAFAGLFHSPAVAVMTGPRALAVPFSPPVSG